MTKSIDFNMAGPFFKTWDRLKGSVFTVHAVDSDCCIFWDLDSNLIHFVEDNLLTIAPNNQAGDKLHARKVCQASFSASLKITFAPYGRAFSPGRKMGTQMFHGEKLKLNWRTMFSDLFFRCMQDNRDVLELFLLELVFAGEGVSLENVRYFYN